MSEKSRLARALAGGNKLVAYLTCGDPSIDTTVDLVIALARAGASAVELGIPFSDPSADGPAIQRAMERALGRGTSLRSVLDVTRRVRHAGCDVPIVLFGYYNPIFVYGASRFARDAAEAGADATLVVDLPVDEIHELLGPARAAGLKVVPLLAPTSTPARIARVGSIGAPFVYYVSVTGITGAALAAQSDVERRVQEIRAQVSCPIAVGFGIATPDDARAIGRFADAVVVGSAIVRVIEENPGRETLSVTALASSLSEALVKGV
ncbi:MAG: tryptophan synthase subunit alpha [Deltaproteobacteria bacterium]|nr:tryptophan synthase subunit alpha [Deltaproteobacteria bacterium]